MRPLALDPRVLRAALRDLESTSDETATAVSRVEAPEEGYPWHDLVDRGVVALLRDAEGLIGSCRRISGALGDSLVDFEELDAHVSHAARARR